MKQIKVTQTNNLWQKIKGLLGENTPHALLLKTHWGIHTFGMQFPIDVVIVDTQNNIVTLKPNLKPNRIFLWNPKYETVLELPSGYIQEKTLKLGEKIHIIV